MIKKINFLFVTFFGIGTIRYAPGTITSLITTVLLYSFFYIINLSNIIIFIFIFLIFLYSFFAVADFIKDNENKDPKEVVIDEFIGQSIPIFLYEVAHSTEKSSRSNIVLCIHIYFISVF